MSSEVKVPVIPPCDLCKDLGKTDVPAVYDSKLIFGPWANVCQEHWVLYGVGQLGTGYGQRLIKE